MTRDMGDDEQDDDDATIGPVAVERRRSGRQAVVAIGRLTAIGGDDDGAAASVLVVDVSLHGCDFRTDDPPGVGTTHRIDVTLGALSVGGRLRVARVNDRADGTFDVAGEFR